MDGGRSPIYVCVRVVICVFLLVFDHIFHSFFVFLFPRSVVLSGQFTNNSLGSHTARTTIAGTAQSQ